MATRMYKAIMGWSEYKDGDEKHSPTHRLLTEEEYDDMVDEIRRLKSLVSQREQEKDAAVLPVMIPGSMWKISGATVQKPMMREK